MKNRIRAFFAVLLAGCASSPAPPSPAPSAAPVKTAQIERFDANARNSPQAMAAPYVVLVSIDGFRHDYLERFHPENLLELAKQGVRAKGLIPAFPSSTFPNHYSIITGLYPDEHGIVANDFYDPDKDQTYNAFRHDVARRAEWYGGEPLWITAHRNQMLSASYFWVASEVPIAGQYPNWYVKYDESIPNEARVDQVIAWLQLPADERPHFITLYFSDVDHAGHEFGPEDEHTGDAVQKVDASIGRLRARLKDLGLPVHLLVVSDHGMMNVAKDKLIDLTDVDLSAFTVSGSGSLVRLHLKPGQPEVKIGKAIREIQALHLPLRASLRKAMAAKHYSKLRRCGDIVVEADAPYYIVKGAESKVPTAAHGWDPKRNENMRGIFLAEGPLFARGVEIPALENVNIFPLIAKILEFKIVPRVSGSLAPTRGALNR